MKTFKMIDPNLIRLYRYFMPYKWRLGFACVFLMGSASMSSITATLLGKMADLGFYQQESWMIYAAPVALIAVTVGFAFCTVMSAYLMAQVSQSVLLTMRGLLFEHILHWPESEFQKHTSGRMSSKFVNEAASALRAPSARSPFSCATPCRSPRFSSSSFGRTGSSRLSRSSSFPVWPSPFASSRRASERSLEKARSFSAA